MSRRAQQQAGSKSPSGQGLACDSTGLGRGHTPFFLAKEWILQNVSFSTPARPLQECPILAGFFCTGGAVSEEGGAR